MSSLGAEASLPDIMSALNVQNKTEFELDEEDEIYEGYGKVENVYPYRPYTCYNRRVKETFVETAVLENTFLKAVFLPGLGGRLWRLIDKETGKNLLYTNDVIRPSNLATRNAWFSGGVEWNVGVIGHTPLTMDPLFTASLEDEEGNPVLRMYEYERIRKVVYQMDFWLEENSRFLHARMRIVNDSEEVIPMYWWSNMAVPEYEKGRILLPAREAFTSSLSKVYKVGIPIVDGVDITKYQDIPDQVDYFFHIPKTEKKYIANINHDGYGLLHISTDRLQSRKLFTWGHNDASARWQEFLTDKAGDYIEIQAGLGKTQYGCIPMAPHTAWEWVEQYGAAQVEAALAEMPYEAAREEMDRYVDTVFLKEAPEQKLCERKALAKKRGRLLKSGSGYGALENACRKKQGKRPLCEHLAFASSDERQKEWHAFLENGCLELPDVARKPADFTKDDIWFQLLQASIRDQDKNNWYAHYQLGLHYLYRSDVERAQGMFQSSLLLTDNIWALHGLAVCWMRKGRREEASAAILRGLTKALADLSYVKEGLRILLQLHAYEQVIEIYHLLDEEEKMESRIRFSYIQALAGIGEYQKAMDLLLTDDGNGMEVEDIREGDDTMDRLWKMLCSNLYGDPMRPIPHRLHFTSLPE